MINRGTEEVHPQVQERGKISPSGRRRKRRASQQSVLEAGQIDENLNRSDNCIKVPHQYEKQKVRRKLRRMGFTDSQITRALLLENMQLSLSQLLLIVVTLIQQCEVQLNDTQTKKFQKLGQSLLKSNNKIDNTQTRNDKRTNQALMNDAVCLDIIRFDDYESEGSKTPQVERRQQVGRSYEDLHHTYSLAPFSLDSRPNDVLVCQICQISSDLQNYLNCPHHFCKNCWQQYVEDKIRNAHVSMIKCPQGCNQEFSDELISQIVSPEIYANFVRFKRRWEVDNDPNKKWCPRPDCENFVERNPSTDIVLCICGTEICFKCGQNSHLGGECENALEIEFQEALSKYAIKYCPNCRSHIQKISGCNHMTCSICHTQFCWVCLSRYHQYHYRYWAFYNGCAIWSNGRFKQVSYPNPAYRIQLFLCPRFIIFILRGPLLLVKLLFKALFKSFTLVTKGLSRKIRAKFNECCCFISLHILAIIAGFLLMPFVFLFRTLPQEIYWLGIKGCAY